MSVEPGLRSAAPRFGRVQAVLVPLVFTLSPVVGMVVLYAQVIPAPPASVARIICFAFMLALVAYAVARRGLDPVTASNVVALPFFLIGMYPAANSFIQRFVHVREPMVSLPYLLMCLISAFAVARTTPAFARTLHELLSIVAAILLAVSLAVVGQIVFIAWLLSGFGRGRREPAVSASRAAFHEQLDPRRLSPRARRDGQTRHIGRALRSRYRWFD